MTRLDRTLRACTLAAAMVMPLACAAPIRVESYAERGANLARFRTYDFAPVEAVATGDPRLDSNPFFNERVQQAVDKGLAAKGYRRARSGTPDMVVHFHASVAQDIDVVDIDRTAGYCSGATTATGSPARADDDCKPFVYDAGTLLMDLVDGQTKKLAWRGWAKTNLDGVVDNQTWLEQRVDTAVERIVAQMPRAASN